MSERLVFHGRFIADGMWLLHLIWGILTIPILGGGLLFCWGAWMSRSEISGPVGAMVFMVFLMLLTVAVGLVMAYAWRASTHAIVLKPDGLWCRPGLVKSMFIPYPDMMSLGMTKDGFGVLYRKQKRGKQVELLFPLPPWAVKNSSFREELCRRAPQMEVSDETSIRVLSFGNRMGTRIIVWAVLVVSPLLGLALIQWAQPARSKGWVIPGLVVSVIALAAMFVWDEIGARRIRRSSHPSATDDKQAK